MPPKSITVVHTRFIAVLCSFLLAMVLLMPGCAEEAPDGAGTLEVVGLKYALLPGGARIVSGALHNIGAEPISGAQIQIALYDSDNRKISSMNVLVRDVQPGEEKPFREAVDSKLDVRGARVKSVIVL